MQILNTMIVLCIGDSCGLPRPGLPYFKTWPSLLKREFPQTDFVNIFKRANTTRSLLESGDTLEYYLLNKVIIQLGIVDCSPRYIKDTNLIFKSLIFIPIPMQKTFCKFWKATHSRSPKRAYVSPKLFKKNLHNYLDRYINLNIESVIIMKISLLAASLIKAPPPLILDSINTYNGI